jgi:hypothetical protein
MVSFSICMPLKIGTHSYSDLDRLISLALPSMHRFLNPAWANEIVLISPKGDIKAIKRALRHERVFKFRILDEDSQFISECSQTGWTKQQILKLSAGRYIDDEWILTLDSDVIITRQINESDLFVGNQATPHLEVQKIIGVGGELAWNCSTPPPL